MMFPDLSMDYGDISAAGQACHFRDSRAGAFCFDLRSPSSPASAKMDAQEIVHSYLRLGIQGIPQRCASSCVIVYDFRAREVFAFSDQEGISPLYYCRKGPRTAIAFSPRAACMVPAPQCEPKAVAAYFSLDYIPAPLSIFKGVYKTPPSSFLHAGKGQVRLKRYAGFPRTPSPANASVLRKEVRPALSSALTAGKESTVGLLLSGGVDSTLLCHLASAHYRRVRTFTLSYPPFNTRTIEKSREVSRAYGCVHQEVSCTVKEYASVFPKTVPLLIEPSFNRNIPIIYRIHAAAPRDVRCMLYGYGGDEMFGDRLLPSSGQRIRRFPWAIRGLEAKAKTSSLGLYYAVKAPRDREVHNAVSRHFNRSVLFPYLDPKVAGLAMCLPERLREHKILLKSVVPQVMALHPITNRENSYEFLSIGRRLLEECHRKELEGSVLLRECLGNAALGRLLKDTSEHTLLKLLVLHLWLKGA